MLASSSKHALQACARSSLASNSAKPILSAWTVHSTTDGMARHYATNRNATRGSFRDRRSPSHAVTQSWEPRRNENMFTINRGAQVADYNMNMRNFVATKRADKVIEIARQMKTTNVQPDVGTYNAIINALALGFYHQEAWAVFRDMLAMEVQPDTTTFNQLLHAHATQRSDEIFRVLGEMEKHDVPPNTRTYDFLVQYFLDCENLEMALVKLAEMNDLGFAPSLHVAQRLIEGAGHFGQVRLALDLADAYEETSMRRLDNETWVRLLVYCAEELYADGVLRCWNKVVNDLNIRVDEGLCQLVLHTAARHGLPVIAAEAIRQLEMIGVTFKEYHFTPMLDALVKNQQLKEAFSVLELMRSANTNPTIDSAHSILESIRYDPQLVDDAYTKLEEIHKEGQKVDVIAANVLIKAAGLLKDLPRAAGIYKSMASLDVKPDTETFDMLLKACRAVQHIELGERLFGELQELGVKPAAETFETFISLILTQTDYENAFYYLEEMKGAGFTPSYYVYENIAKTCVVNGDDRYKLALEELEQMGYRVSGRLRNFINSGGREWSEQLSESEKLPREARRALSELKQATDTSGVEA